MEFPIDSQGQLNEVALQLIRSVFPPAKGVRLVGVSLSNFRSPEANSEEQLPLR
jgi:DNA polymerase-4